jgi:hypothetical protein
MGQNVEVVHCVTPPLNLPFDGAQVLINWSLEFLLAASTTSVRYRIYRGATAAGVALTLANQLTAAAGSTILLSGCYIDTPGIVAGVQYCATLLTVGAASQGTIGDVCMIAYVL